MARQRTTAGRRSAGRRGGSRRGSSSGGGAGRRRSAGGKGVGRRRTVSSRGGRRRGAASGRGSVGRGAASRGAASHGAASRSGADRGAAGRAARKDARGGLTAAGREYFRRKEGAHLKPGVKKANSAMSPQDMRRKGSWAVRFYGRKGALPPLIGTNGKPTRFALTAAAWGEPVPSTVAAARRIAAKGRRLLAQYERTKRS